VGAVSLWIPLHQMGTRELKAIVGSFIDVFPATELYLSGANAILLGSVGGGTRTERLARLRAPWPPAVAEDMRRAQLGTPEELDVERVAGPEELRRFVAGTPRNTDDRPWVELTLPRHIYRDTTTANVEALLALRPTAEADQPLPRAFEAIQRSYLLADAGRNGQALELLRSTLVEGRSPMLEHAARMRHLSARYASDLYEAGRRDEALSLVEAEIERPDADVDALMTIADLLQRTDRQDLRSALAERIVREWPRRPEGHMLQGAQFVDRGRYAEAIPSLETALELDEWEGYAWQCYSLLGRARIATGDFEAGRRDIRRSLELRPDQPGLVALLDASREQLIRLERSLGDAGTR
jgi:tetratricopeptide (TPR) repeat protein